MWVNKRWFESVIESNEFYKSQVDEWKLRHIASHESTKEIATQKAKDDITIDWMRHRINALEKERTILLQKAAGILLPTPEIEITPARQAVADLNWDHGFEDVGDTEAARLGIHHNDLGEVIYGARDRSAQEVAVS